MYRVASIRRKKVTPRKLSFIHVADKRPRIDTPLYAAHIKPLIKAFQQHIICAIILTQCNVMRCSLKGIIFTSCLLLFGLLHAVDRQGSIRGCVGKLLIVAFQQCIMCRMCTMRSKVMRYSFEGT